MNIYNNAVKQPPSLASASLAAIIALLLSVASLSVYAQAESSLVLPQPLEQGKPDFRRPDREAAVHVRYTIKADGTTADIEVLDSFSNGLFNNAAVNGVEDWRFTPASSDGTAIDLLNQEYIIDFVSDNGSGISPQVRRAFDRLVEQLENENYQMVVDELQTMLAGDISSVFDYMFLNDLLTSAYTGLNMTHEALAASQRATMMMGPVANSAGAPGSNILTPELLETALRKRFLLAISVSQNEEAMRVYERLDNLVDLPGADPIHAQANLVRDSIESPNPLGLLAKITDNNSWKFRPGRRIIAVTEVSSGSIDTLDIRCQRRNVQLEFQEGVEWNLPASFGECELEFKGENGTQFTIYEFTE